MIWIDAVSILSLNAWLPPSYAPTLALTWLGSQPSSWSELVNIALPQVVLHVKFSLQKGKITKFFLQAD